MNLELLRKYCIQKPGVTESFPFDEETLVFKVMGKIFALVNTVEIPLSVNLKCNPEKAIELREKYDSVQPGYHMNKTHWNTVIMDNTIPHDELCELVDDSYNLVVSGLKKSDREKLNLIKK